MRPEPPVAAAGSAAAATAAAETPLLAAASEFLNAACFSRILSSSLLLADDFLSNTFLCPSFAMASASRGRPAARRARTSSRSLSSARCSSSYSCLAASRRRRACSCSSVCCSRTELASWASRAWFARIEAVFSAAYFRRASSVLATSIPSVIFEIISSRCSRKSS